MVQRRRLTAAVLQPCSRRRPPCDERAVRRTSTTTGQTMAEELSRSLRLDQAVGQDVARGYHTAVLTREISQQPTEESASPPNMTTSERFGSNTIYAFVRPGGWYCGCRIDHVAPSKVSVSVLGWTAQPPPNVTTWRRLES